MPVLAALKSKWTPVGVDLGGGGVRCVQAAVVDGHYTIKVAVRCEAALGGAAAEKGDNAAQGAGLLAECRRKARFKGCEVIAAVMTPDIDYHSLELPAAALASDADEIVHFEVERLMTNPPKELETRFWPLPKAFGAAPNALAVGASREVIDRVLQACSSARLTCSSIDAAGLALSRFGFLLESWPASSVWGILDLGERRSRLVLCVGDCPVLVRTVSNGGRIWTQRIAEALQLSFKAAEVHKRTHGIALTSRDARPAETDGARAELASMLLGALRLELNDLATEVKRSYEYVLSCYPNCRAADLVLVGGGAGMRNLPEHLANALGIPVRRASEYLGGATCRIAFAEGRREPMECYAVAIGLTVRD